MFLTRGQPQRGRLTNFRYGTAGTTTTTTLASQGGLLINIDSATGDVPQTASGWIEDEKYGMYAVLSTAGFSAEFDSTVTRTGNFTVKVSTTDATGRGYVTNSGGSVTSLGLQRLFIKVKPSTKYRTGCWIKTTNANTVFFRIQGYSITLGGGTNYDTATVTGTTDWTYYTTTFTTGGTIEYARFALYNNIAGNVSDAWFDINSMTLEEVVEPVANSLVTPSPSLVSFTAVGSTDNIDQSLDPTFAAANTYTPPTAISETATNKQTFVPTKSKMTRIGVYPVAKGTGNWTVTVHDASNVVQASITIANASLTNGAVNYFNVPCNLTAGATYHFHVTSTVADGTVRVATSNDLETCSYIQNYYKPTTNFKASQNNLSVSVSADEDGFLESSVLNLTTGAWSFTDPINDGAIQNNMYFTKTTGVIFVSNAISFSGAGQEYKLKINLGLVATSDLTYTIGFIANNTFSYSYDNGAYTNLGTLVASGGSFTIPMVGQTTVYIKNVANASGSMTNHSASCSVNTTSINGVLKNYPTNKDIIKQYATTLGGATTSATYRATKWGFPAIEYLPLGVSSTGLAARYDFLGNANDTSGNGLNGTVVGPTLTTGRFGDSNSAYDFSGTNQYITLPQNAMPLTFPLTISVWARPDVVQVGANDVILMVGDAVANQGYGIAFGGTTGASINKIFGFGFGLSNTQADAIYTVGNTYHIVFTIDSGKVSQLFINGVKQASTVTYTTLSPAGTGCEVGRLYANDTRALDGAVYGLASWNRVLSDAEVLALYNQGQINQYLDVDTTATGSTVAFSELGTTYTTVADGTSLAISSTSTPNLFVKANITANRLYLSSNDTNASSDKDGSLRQTLTYNVIQ